MKAATKQITASVKKTPDGRNGDRPSREKSSRSEKAPAYRPLISEEKLRGLYSAMLGCRLLEERGRRKRRKPNEVTPAAVGLSTGLEAVIVGATFDLRSADTITAPSGEVILRHNDRTIRHSRTTRESAPRDVIAFATASGAQLTVGAGIALGNKHHNTDSVVVSFGDADPGSISSWNEALHLAGLHHLPILLVLRPAPKTSTEWQTALATITESANIAGVMMIPVDAADVVAMYRVSFEAIARARNGTGATLIVSTPFEVDGASHSSPTEDASDDPLIRMEEYLTRKGLFSKQWKQTLVRQFA